MRSQSGVAVDGEEGNIMCGWRVDVVGGTSGYRDLMFVDRERFCACGLLAMVQRKRAVE